MKTLETLLVSASR